MPKHLIFEGTNLLDHDIQLQNVNTWQYLKRRVQFWKWHKHRTMGRPVLKLWKDVK